MSIGQHRLSRRDFFMLMGVAIAAAMPGCTPADDASQETFEPTPRSLEQIKTEHFLRVGILTDNRPLSYLDRYGNYAGIDGYLCPYLYEKTGLPIEYVAVDPRDRYETLLSGAADICIASMSPSDAQSDDVIFTRPYVQLQLGLVSPNDAKVEDVSTLKPGELVVCEGSYAAQYVEERWPELEPRSFKTLTDTMAVFKNGQAAALLGDEIYLSAWLKVNNGYALSMRGIDDPRTIAVAIRAGEDDLCSYIDKHISSFIANGYSRKAYEKYVESAVKDDYSSILLKNAE